MSVAIDPTGIVLVSRLLSVGFTPPDDGSVEEMSVLTALAGRRACEEGLAELLAELELALNDEGAVAQLPAEYEGLFGGAVRCPPYEGSYEADPFRGSRQMADLAGFYRAFGAESSGPAAERPDHAGCELEFLSFLAARRLEAEEAGETESAAICLEAEDAFLRDHLGRWLPALCREVGEASSSPVYTLLAAAGERFVAAELARRGIEPALLRRRGRRSAVEGDAFACGDAEVGPQDLS